MRICGQVKLPYAQFYEQWMPLSPLSVPTEPRLDCRSCQMVQPRGLTRDRGPFRADLKCCTHFPFIPNFTVGALLEQQNVRIEDVLKAGFATPIGIFSPQRGDSDDFGQNPLKLCPFFDRGGLGCSIWQHRPGVCSSYVCQSSEGATGLEAWAKLEERVNLFEWTLAHEVLWRLGFTSDETSRMREGYWAEHADRKLEFYRKAYVRAREVAPSEIAALMDEL